MIVFGPTPSRRLGQSLGINNIPPKICSYSCIYCQVGRTLTMQLTREAFYKPEEILKEVEEKVKGAQSQGETIDFLTFVSDGEPTLDINLEREIELLKSIGIKIAVITNASLVGQKDVQNTLCKADWVSLKIDAISENTWFRINRPYKSIQLDNILNGITEFSQIFKGELVTETMLIKDINDNEKEIEKIADFITGIQATRSYIAIPTRPPAEKWVKAASEHTINMAFQLFKKKAVNAEYLIGYEGNTFAFTGNATEDLLSITSVHPMREDAVNEFLKKAKADWDTVEKLVNENELMEVLYEDKKFYIRRYGIKK